MNLVRHDRRLPANHRRKRIRRDLQMLYQVLIPCLGGCGQHPGCARHRHTGLNRSTIWCHQPVDQAAPGVDSFGHFLSGSLQPAKFCWPIAGVQSAAGAGMGGVQNKFCLERIGILRGPFVAPHIDRCDWGASAIQTHQRMPVGTYAYNGDVIEVGPGPLAGFGNAPGCQASYPQRIAHAATVGRNLKLVAFPMLGIT